jgi:2-polyprenyl-3-methyl-5-hydroxy-6-metoxy-1,4-benzoquinol methylase
MDRKIHRYHEQAYKTMKASGICCWEKLLSPKNGEIDKQSQRFLKEVCQKKWFPQAGTAIEFGCGTAPILRLICKKGFNGVGVDISKTAITMAQEQTQLPNISFKRMDVCSDDVEKIGKFDVVIDGHCLHCVVAASNRKKFLKNAYKILNQKGVVIIMTMCGEINKKQFIKTAKGAKIVKDVLYVPHKKDYLPVRKISVQKIINREIQQAGFNILLAEYIQPVGKDPFGSLMIAAMKE